MTIGNKLEITQNLHSNIKSKYESKFEDPLDKIIDREIKDSLYRYFFHDRLQNDSKDFSIENKA